MKNYCFVYYFIIILIIISVIFCFSSCASLYLVFFDAKENLTVYQNNRFSKSTTKVIRLNIGAFCPGHSQAGRQVMKRTENKKLKSSMDGFEDLESKINNNPDGGGEDNSQQPDNQGKNLKTEMEQGDGTNVKQLKDLKQRQRTSGLDEDDCKIPSNNRAGMKSNVNSAKDSAVKTKADWSNGNVVLKSDKEELRDCCQRKRKRHEMHCSQYDPKLHGSGLTCIGILPGLGGNIESSDDSDQSCSSGSEGNENVKYDLLGRSIIYERKCPTGSG